MRTSRAVRKQVRTFKRSGLASRVLDTDHFKVITRLPHNLVLRAFHNLVPREKALGTRLTTSEGEAKGGKVKTTLSC